MLLRTVVLAALVTVSISATQILADTQNGIAFKTDTMIDAESGTVGGEFKILGDDEASGKKCVAVPEAGTTQRDVNAVKGSPELIYNVRIDSLGDYYVWFRVFTANNSAKSFYLTVDNKKPYKAILSTVDNSQWQWIKTGPYKLGTGMHAIEVIHRETLFKIDGLYVTKTGIQPTGVDGIGGDPLQGYKMPNNPIKPIRYPELTARDIPDTNFPKPPSTHPRLFLNQAIIAKLKEKAANPDMQVIWDNLVKCSELNTDGKLRAVKDKGSNYSIIVRLSIEAKALRYALYGDKNVGRAAVDAMVNFYDTVRFDTKIHDIYRSYGNSILAGAMVYDWCYDLLSPAEKARLIGGMETIAQSLELGWPDIKQGALSGHGAEFQLQRDLIAAGVAVYDEKKEIYNLAAGRFFKEYVPARKFWQQGEFHPAGSSYGLYRFTAELMATEIFDAMGFPKVYGDSQPKVLYRNIYNKRPDNMIMQAGDDFAYSADFGKMSSGSACAYEIAASYFEDPVLMGEFVDSFEKKFGTLGDDSHDYIYDFLFYDPSIKAVSLAAAKLPLAKYFPSPLGSITARTSWDSGIDSSGVLATMDLSVYKFNGHNHLDSGNFQLYYKGPLTVDSGIYQGIGGGYGCNNDMNYAKRSIAHNTILVYDPSEKVTVYGRDKTHDNKPIVSDGGQRWPNDGREPGNMDELTQKGYKTGEVLAHKIGPDPANPEYTYLKGDLTAAYTSKVSQYTRSFVFLNLNTSEHPAALIVFDKITSSNKDFKKTWLMHMVEEPRIDGNITTVTATKRGYNGKMVNTTLLPLSENLVINKVGGPGHEYDIRGINYPTSILNADKLATDSSAWRIEISPITAANDDEFLNVMQVMDNHGGPCPLNVKKINSDKMVGTTIADRVVLFSKSGEKINDTISFKVDGAGQMKFLVTDLKPGFWTAQKFGDIPSAQYKVDEDGATIYFSGGVGQYTLTRFNSSVAGIPAVSTASSAGHLNNPGQVK